MKDCRHARRWVERSLDGTLSLEDRFRLEQHLERCAPCRGLHARHAALAEALERLPEPAFERLDVESALGEIRAALDTAPRASRAAPESSGATSGATPDPRTQARKRRAAALAVAATATVAAAAAILVLLLRGGAERREPSPPPLVDERAPGDPAPPAVPDGAPARGEHALAGAVVPESDSAPLDAQRLAGAREEIALALLDELGALAPDAPRAEVEAAAARFDERARELHAARWPVASIAAGLLERGEPRVARAAARFLGVRGGPVEVHALRAALSRSDVERDAVRALGHAGAPGLAGLADALRDPELAADARAAIGSVGGGAAAAVLAEAAARGGASSDEALAALSALGPPAIEQLLRLAGRGDLDDARLAALVDASPGGRAELDRLAREDLDALPADCWLAAARALQPPALLGWLVERCAERALLPEALAALSRYGGEPAATALLAASRAPGIPAEELAPAAGRMVAASGPAFVSLARELAGAQRRLEVAALIELLATAARPEGVPALLALSGDARLDEANRQWAALAAREAAAPEHLALFEQGFTECGARERRLAAAYLLAFADLAGLEAALALVDPRTSRDAGQLRRLLETAAQSGANTALLQLGRELEPYLLSDDPQRSFARSRRNIQ